MVLVASPEQFSPPLEGAGLLHCLLQDSVPSPQVMLQPAETHSPQCPSEMQLKRVINCDSYPDESVSFAIIV